jgi:hypothetical protein
MRLASAQTLIPANRLRKAGALNTAPGGMTAGHASNAPINGSGGFLHSLMPVRQNPKNHQRDKGDIKDVCCRNGPVRRPGRAGITELPASGTVRNCRKAMPLVIAAVHDEHDAIVPRRHGSWSNGAVQSLTARPSLVSW